MSDLASRITDPKEKSPEDNKTAEAPAAEQPSTTEAPADAPADTQANAEAEIDGQVDGTIETLGGSGLQEPEWDVEVSLSDLQNNEATPFHSATTWQDLGL